MSKKEINPGGADKNVELALALSDNLPLLAYNFNAITHNGDYAHIQGLTKRNHSTISKISLERQFLKKNIQT